MACTALRFRLRRKKPRKSRAIKATAATPITIPALTPVERLLLLLEVDVAVDFDCVGHAVRVVVLVTDGMLTVEKSVELMSHFSANQKLCPLCGSVIFEFIDTREFDLTCKCQSVPFAAFAR